MDGQEPGRAGAGEGEAGDRRAAGSEPVGRHPGEDRADKPGGARDTQREAGRGQAETAAVVQEDDHDRQRHPGADLEEEDAAEEPPGARSQRRNRASDLPSQGA